MTKQTEDILPARNEARGLWGTSEMNGLEPDFMWKMGNEFFMRHYGLCAEDARNLLDSTFGRHVADAIADDKTLGWMAENWDRAIRKCIAKTKAHRELFQAELAEF